MITLTERAAEKVKFNLERRGKGIGIKVGVKTTGCSGLAYVLEFVDNDMERCMEHHDQHGVRVFMDPRHRPYLYGMTMDWIKQGLNEGFDFQNPNEKSTCGCGHFFTV